MVGKKLKLGIIDYTAGKHFLKILDVEGKKRMELKMFHNCNTRHSLIK